VTYKLRGWERESMIKLPHIVSNVIGKYKPVISGVKVIFYLNNLLSKDYYEET